MDISCMRRYVFEAAGSNMYIFSENKKALVIDPFVCEEALSQLNKDGIEDAAILLTHEHYDHVSGVVWLNSLLSCTIICHEETNASLQTGRNNRPVVIAARLMNSLPREKVREVLGELPIGFKCSADVTFTSKFQTHWNGHSITFIPTPGHSPGSCCIEIDDNIVATGDSLIPNTKVITSFPGGNLKQFESEALPYLRSINDGMWVLPGHGEPFIKDKHKE